MRWLSLVVKGHVAVTTCFHPWVHRPTEARSCVLAKTRCFARKLQNLEHALSRLEKRPCRSFRNVAFVAANVLSQLAVKLYLPGE